MNVEGMIEDLKMLQEARAEFVTRMQELAKLTGAEFNAAAGELSAWVSEVNEDLNDVAQDMLGEALAIDAEALVMMRLERGAPSPNSEDE